MYKKVPRFSLKIGTIMYWGKKCMHIPGLPGHTSHNTAIITDLDEIGALEVRTSTSNSG